MANEPIDPAPEGETTPPLKARPKKKVKFDPKVAAPIVADKFRQAQEMFQERVEQIVPHPKDDPEKWYFKLLGFSFVGLMVIMLLVGVLVFLLTLRSPEMVSVPQVKGLALPEALETLQDYGLLGRIQQKNSDNPADKGTVLDQEPRAGNHVRVGREITLVVSKGAVVDVLAAYTGRNIEDVRQEIKTRFGQDKPALQIGQLTWSFDESEEGTILSQDPLPGTPLNPAVTVTFMVSRGTDSTALDVPDLAGLDWREAMDLLGGRGIPFVFSKSDSAKNPGTIISQDPKPTQKLPGGSSLMLTVSLPEAKDKQIPGFFEMNLPVYSIPVEISVFTEDETGKQTLIHRFKHLGGRLTFPYLVNEGSTLVIQAIGKEISRTRIGKAAAGDGSNE